MDWNVIVTVVPGVDQARAAGKPWSGFVARVIPVETVISFTPETLVAQLKEAVGPLVARMAGGTYCVRLERRGLAGRVSSREVEREVADYVHALATGQGKAVRTDLEDPDFLIAGETLGAQCGVALLSRAMRRRYAFVAAH